MHKINSEKGLNWIFTNNFSYLFFAFFVGFSVEILQLNNFGLVTFIQFTQMHIEVTSEVCMNCARRRQLVGELQRMKNDNKLN